MNPVLAAMCSVALLLFLGCSPPRGPDGEHRGASGSRKTVRITVFAGAASQPATTEVARQFETETGIVVDCTFGGSGSVLNQIRIETYGDVYLPGSEDYMDIAETENLVRPETRRVICYLAPVICVMPGNPKQIRRLGDLSGEGTRVAIGDPQSVCLGSLAVRAMEKAGVYESVRRNIVTYASDCQQVVSLIRLGEVDASIGYDVFERQSPGQVESIPLEGIEAVNIPAAVVVHSRHGEEAQQFIDYISGPKGKEVFARHGYTTEKPE